MDLSIHVSMESVQEYLEGMVPELEHNRKLGIFSEEEIRRIVKQRRHFELATRKRNVRPVDYLRYIRYELQYAEWKIGGGVGRN